MDLFWIRVYLLLGLIAHKLLWEVLKRSDVQPKRGSVSLRIRVVKSIKLGILFGIFGQVFLPDIFPITADASLIRTLGLLLFTSGLALAMWARVLLDKNWSDIESAIIKNRHEVVDRGIYRYIRHPIYVGDLLLLLGFQLALNSLLFIAVLVLAPIVLRQAVREEKILLATLPGYAQYAERTRRFLPFIA